MSARTRPGRPSRPSLTMTTTAVVAILAACGGGGTGNRARPTTSSSVPLPTTTTAPPAVSAGTFGVGQRTDMYVDASRPTPANGTARGAPTRTMATTVLYPATGPPGSAPTANAPPAAAGRPYPLLVFAHGFDATPAMYASLLSGWASAGYVVVAPTIPLLNADAPGGPDHTDYGVPNITDLDFALSEALRRSATPGDPIAGLVDPNRIAVAGHSDGEVLAYALAFEACCHDPRVKAVIPMAGNLANAEAAPSPTGVPVLHIMNDHDQYDPYAASIAWDRQNLATPRYLLTLVSEVHAPAYTDPNDPHFDLVVRATLDFLDGTLNGRPDATAALQSLVAGAPTLATLETAGAPGQLSSGPPAP